MSLPIVRVQMRSLLGAPNMSAGPEDARGLRRASIGNASVAPRDTEKLARLRRARKEAARDIEAERRTDDARVTELHAQLDAKLRERNERRVRLLRLESERIAVEREVRFAHAAAERDAAATRLDAERGDEAAKKEARRVAFLARRRAAASGVASRAAAEERWERLNETAADEAARTPRLRETRSFVAYDAMAVSQFGREMNEGVAATTENVLAAFESAAAVSAASPVPPPPPPTEFEFAVAVGVAARVASPSRGDAAICAARLGVSRGRDDRLRRVANERGAPDDVLETETEKEPPFVAGSDSDDARSDVSEDSAESVLETAPGIESPDRMRGRMRVRAGGVAWTSPSSAPPSSALGGERGERVRPALENRRLQRASETSKPSPSNLRSACKKNANVSFSALGTYATDSPDPARLMPGEEAEVASRVLYRRVALELAAPKRRSADDADRALRDATLAAETGDVSYVSSFGTCQVSNANRTDPTRDAAETRDAKARERRRGRRGRRRPETRREKMFGKLPFRVAGAALDATRVVGGGALRGVGGLLRGLRGIVRGGDEDDAEEPSPL